MIKRVLPSLENSQISNTIGIVLCKLGLVFGMGVKNMKKTYLFHIWLKMNRNFLIIFFLLFTMIPGAFSHATQLPYELISEFWTVLQDDDVNGVKTLLDKHPELIEIRGGTIQLPPLSQSILQGNWDMFSLFVFEKKADLNATGQTDITTPLHLTGNLCHPRMAKALIEEGVEVDTEDLMAAVIENCLSVASILLENGADPFAIFRGPIKSWLAKEYAFKVKHNPQMAALLADWEKRRRSLSSRYRRHRLHSVDNPDTHFCDTYEELWFGTDAYYGDQKSRAQHCLNTREEWISNKKNFNECTSLAYFYEEGAQLYNRECRGLKPSEKLELTSSDLLRYCLTIQFNFRDCGEETEKILNMYLQSHDNFPISSVSRNQDISQLFPEPTSFPGKEITWGEIASSNSITKSGLDPFGWFGASATFNQNLQFRGKYLQNGSEYYSYYENEGCVLFHYKEYAGPYDFPEIEKGDVYGISDMLFFGGKVQIWLRNKFYELNILKIECKAGALPLPITSDSTIFEFLKILRGIITVKLHSSL